MMNLQERKISFNRVICRLGELTSAFAQSKLQRQLLERAIHIQANRLHRRENHVSFRIPLLVYSALRGDEHPALDLAAATLLLYMGTDLLDDLADGDMAPEWAGTNIAQVQLIAIGLFATIPQWILTQIDTAPEIVVALQRVVSLASARMAAGQLSDIGTRDNTEAEPDLQSTWRSIEEKSGAAIALLAEAGALLAGAPEAVPGYAAFGQALGSSFCLMEDCRNLMDGPDSTDLMNGTRSYPIVLHLSGIRGEEARRRFAELLRGARQDSSLRQEVLARMSAAGTFRVAGLVIDSCRRRGMQTLDELNPLEPAGSALRRFLEFGNSASV